MKNDVVYRDFLKLKKNYIYFLIDDFLINKKKRVIFYLRPYKIKIKVLLAPFSPKKPISFFVYNSNGY